MSTALVDRHDPLWVATASRLLAVHGNVKRAAEGADALYRARRSLDEHDAEIENARLKELLAEAQCKFPKGNKIDVEDLTTSEKAVGSVVGATIFEGDVVVLAEVPAYRVGSYRKFVSSKQWKAQ